jgi:transposase
VVREGRARFAIAESVPLTSHAVEKIDRPWPRHRVVKQQVDSGRSNSLSPLCGWHKRKETADRWKDSL